MLKELQSYTAAADERVAKMAGDATIFNRADLFTDRDTKRPTVAVHSLPLAEFVGCLTMWRARLSWPLNSNAFKMLPARRRPTNCSAAPPAAIGRRGGSSLQYVRLMRQQLPTAAWNQPALVGRAMSTQLRGERVAVPEDERVKNWTLPLIAAGDQAARQARDRLFAGDASSLTAAEPFWSDADHRYAQAEKLGKTVAAAFEVRDRAYAETAVFGRVARSTAVERRDV